MGVFKTYSQGAQLGKERLLKQQSGPEFSNVASQGEVTCGLTSPRAQTDC